MAASSLRMLGSQEKGRAGAGRGEGGGRVLCAG